MKALIVSADNFEDSELLVPYYRLQEAGCQVEVSAGEKGTIHGKHGYEVKVDKSFSEVDPTEYSVLILPGGKAPAAIRHNPEVQGIARYFMANDKPVGAICHGPQMLISAGLLAGRHATCYRTVAKEMQECGALYEDREVVVDGKLVTSREPSDLPAFLREVMRLLPHIDAIAPDTYWGEGVCMPLATEAKKNL